MMLRSLGEVATVTAMRRLGYLVAANLALSACGTTVENADVPTGIYAGASGRDEIADDPSVVIVETGLSVADGGKRVYGTSCKNKIWQPAPSRDNAVALMKRQAKEMGLNAIHAVEVKDDPSALAKNCWAAIVASGIAFVAAPPQ